MQGLWDRLLAQGEDRLDHPCDSRRRLGVADVRLDRAEAERSPLSPVFAVGGEQRPCLDRVPEGGAGAVGLDHVDVFWLKARVCERLADHPLLRWSVGRGEPV